jgi:hypothetical protein
MDLEDVLPVELPTSDSGLTRPFYLFVLVPTLLGVAHHLDHVVRGNHVGWPLTPEVNPFTYSLAIYPLLAVGLYLSLTRRVGAGYWVGFFACSTGMLVYFHLSPWAVEPPQDVMVPYANPVAGYVAFGVLLALVASVGVGAAYGIVLWYRARTGSETVETTETPP